MTSTDLEGFSNPYADEEKEEDLGFMETAGDLIAAPFRGAGAAVGGVANLFGADIDTADYLGESKTVAGGFLEGISQFLVGFFPGLGVAGAAGGMLSKYAAVANAGAKVGKVIGAGKAAKLATGVKNAAAGSLADFAVIDSNDPRLANLLQAIPGLESDLGAFLAADPDSNPGDLMGRMKNTLEGAGLGLITDGVLRMIKGIGKVNWQRKNKDFEGADKTMREIEIDAEDTHNTPIDALDAQSDDLLDPESTTIYRPEEDTYDPFEDDILGPETVSPESLEERVGWDPDEGITVLAKGGKATDKALNGFTQFEEFAREPGGRLQIIQLKKDARILSSKREMRKLAGKQHPQQTKAEYELQIQEAARRNGYDAVSYGRGNDRQVQILSEDGIAKRINVESEESLYKRRSESQAIKINSIVKNSRVESAIHHMDLSDEGAIRIATAMKAAIDDPTEEHLQAIAGVVNLSKLGERGNRAFFKVITEEFDHAALVTVKDWDQTVAETADVASKMMGTDPQILAARGDAHSDSVEASYRFAAGARFYMNTKMTQMRELAQSVLSWDDTVASKGKLPKGERGEELSKSAAMEMLNRNIEGIHSLGRSISRLRSTFGRGLNSFKISATRMTENSLMRSLELRGGDVNHVLKTAKKLVEMMKLENGAQVASAMLIHTTKKAKFMKGMTDYYMSSLLSAPKTLTTNIIGSIATAVFKPLEASLGAWVGKKLFRPEMAVELERAQRTNLRAVTLMANSIFELTSLRKATQDIGVINKAAKDTFKSGDGQLVPQSAWIDSNAKTGKGLSLENFNDVAGTDFNPEDGMGAGIQMFMNGLNLPSSIMASSDEWVKQMAYHAHVRSELMEQAQEQGIGRLQGPVRGGSDQSNTAIMDRWVDNEMRKITIDGVAKTDASVRAATEKEFPRDRFADPENRLEHIEQTSEARTGDVDPTDGNEVKNRSFLMDRALKFAREVTHTTPLDPEGGPVQKFGHFLQQFTDDHPMMRFFTPFIRTPLNLLSFTADRLPIPGLNKDFPAMVSYLGQRIGILPKRLQASQSKWMAAVTSSDAQEAAEAFGRATTAFGVLSVVGTTAFASDMLTGAGPSDLEQRKVLQASGWQPYSIKVGDTYVSYQRMDPFAGALALAADMADVTRFGASDLDLEEITLGYFAATIENLASKSYLAGVMDMFDMLSDPEKNIPKTAERIVGSLVPNVIGAARSFTDSHFDEVQGVIDRIKSRIPLLSDDVNLQRNVLGEAVNKKTFTGALQGVEGLASYMLPVQINTTGSDTIDNELADLAFPFRAPSKSKFGVDLRDYANDEGQTYYDRWQQLSSEVKVDGRTLRSAMGRMMGSLEYKRLDKLPVDALDIDSPRISMINSLVGEYRRVAEQKALKEFPELRDQTALQRTARQRLQGGADSADIDSLLSGN